MIIYNVTIKIQLEIYSSWLEWLKKVHIPEILATGCFTKTTILKLLEVDDTEGPTYAIQYFAETMEAYEVYIDQFAVVMRQRSFDKWGNKFIAFRSLMQVVN
ncbi:MAG: DUF4286 family protein [Ferruginibacter sp.]|nr:DUF4286 family protein [Ferruginibacter sp.]